MIAMACFRTPSQVLHQRLDGESVMLSLASGEYFRLDAVATRMFEALLRCGDEEEALDVLEACFEATRETLRRDLAVLRDQLLTEGLLEPCPPAEP